MKTRWWVVAVAILGGCMTPTPTEMTSRKPAHETQSTRPPRDALLCVQQRLAEVRHIQYRPPMQQLVETPRGLELWADAPGPPFSSVVGATESGDGSLLRWYDGGSSLAVCEMCRRWYGEALDACR